MKPQVTNPDLHPSSEGILAGKKVGKDIPLVVAIVTAKEWFKHHAIQHYPVMPTDFIVCRWYEYSDGNKNSREGKETIAICRQEDHARLIYKSLCEK